MKDPPSSSPGSRRVSPSLRGSQGELPVLTVHSSQMQISPVTLAQMQGEPLLAKNAFAQVQSPLQKLEIGLIATITVTIVNLTSVTVTVTVTVTAVQCRRQWVSVWQPLVTGQGPACDCRELSTCKLG